MSFRQNFLMRNPPEHFLILLFDGQFLRRHQGLQLCRHLAHLFGVSLSVCFCERPSSLLSWNLMTT